MCACNSVHYSCNNTNDILKDGFEFHTAGDGKRFTQPAGREAGTSSACVRKQVSRSPIDKAVDAVLSDLAHSDRGWAQ